MKKILLTFVAIALGVTVSAQWPSNTNEVSVISLPGQSDYGCETATSHDGITYVAKIVPQHGDEAGRTVLSYRLYILDKDGVLQSPTDGLDIATEPNRSWTAVNNSLFVDRDGNAIVMCCDSRNANETSTDQGYIIYKVNPKGEVMWVSDLDEGRVYELPVSINCAQDTDGNYLFAFTPMSYDEESATPLRLEKLNKDSGETIWTRTLSHETRPYVHRISRGN